MQEGSFYAAACKSPSPASWLTRPFSRSFGDKQIDTLLHGVIRRSSSLNHSDGDSTEQLSRTNSGSEKGSICDVILEPQALRLTGGGVVVKHGMFEVAGGALYRIAPHVVTEQNAFVVFYGYLSNLEQLMLEARGRDCRDYQIVAPSSPSSVPSGDRGNQCAAVLLALYHKCKGRDEDLLVVLSELQGQYAFVVYDAQRKAVFAARDPSGKERLFYNVDDDGVASFTNSPFDVPEAGQTTKEWTEIPPGHYVSGRQLKLQQFALTQEELYARDFLDGVEAPAAAQDVFALDI